jgi:hypothetical protein
VPIWEIVSQISPPLRILIAGAVVFLALWFTVLRPKSGGDATPTAAATPTPATGNVNTGTPAVSGVGKVVQNAKTTVAGAEQSAKAAAGEATATAPATTSTGTAAGSATTSAPDAEPATAAIPAKVLAELPKDVADALSARKVLVLAVLSDDATRWRPLADDDRYVRNTLKHVNRYDGSVLVKQVPLAQLSTYGPLVNDLHVNQTPSIVVVDRDLKADVLAGYVDRISINQAIADARDRSTSPRITDAFLRQANQVCANGNVSFDRWSLPTIPGRKAWLASGRRARADLRAYRHAVGKLVAPAKWRGLKRQWLAELAGEQRWFDKALGKAAHNDLAGAVATALAWDDSAARKLDHRFDAVGLTSCSQLRRQ